MAAHEHVVVLGDVFESRDIPDRSAFGSRLDAVLDRVNAEFRASIHTDFERIRGIDEIGGVLHEVAPVYEIVRTINLALHPSHIRFVAVQGTIDVNVESVRIAQMDGPAFHEANALMAAIEETGLFFGLKTPADELMDLAIEIQVNLLYLLWAGWTQKQVEALLAYRQFETQAAAARALGITQQTLSERLRAINWRQILALEGRLVRCLTECEQPNTR